MPDNLSTVAPPFSAIDADFDERLQGEGGTKRKSSAVDDKDGKRQKKETQVCQGEDGTWSFQSVEDIESQTNVTLQRYLKDHGLPKTGKKEILVEKVKAHYFKE